MKRTFLILALSFGALCAQSGPAQLAGLLQDMSLVQRELGQLRLEVDALRKENAALRAQLGKAGGDAIADLRRDMDAQNAATKKQILTEVSKQIESLAAQMQAAFDKLADAKRVAPATPTQVTFSEDYDKKNGVVYEVKAGDTLSSIARAHGANMRDIQNANKIANPARDLRVGQTIFIPAPKK